MHLFRFESSSGPHLGIEIEGARFDLTATAPEFRDMATWLALANPVAQFASGWKPAADFQLQAMSPFSLPSTTRKSGPAASRIFVPKSREWMKAGIARTSTIRSTTRSARNFSSRPRRRESRDMACRFASAAIPHGMFRNRNSFSCFHPAETSWVPRSATTCPRDPSKATTRSTCRRQRSTTAVARSVRSSMFE